jgi:HD superfamily phosphodiesterase
MLWSRFISRLFKEAKPYLQARDDFKHARISHQYALLLMGREQGDKKIVEPAVILHDVGWSCLAPQQIALAYGVRAGGLEALELNRIHEVQGAVITRRILQALDYDAVSTDQITRIVERHDSGTEIATAEEGLVKDADKLWRFSQIGFWKEMERQQVGAEELYRHLDKHFRTWFFSLTAQELAEKELRRRAQEMRQVRPETPDPVKDGVGVS